MMLDHDGQALLSITTFHFQEAALATLLPSRVRLRRTGGDPGGCSLQSAPEFNIGMSNLYVIWVCTRSWLLDGCQPTLRSVDLEGKIGSVSGRVPG
ncbi:hypothetical protein ANN_14757 [Periplaneta americana]|uniref:Uncharacterized protein n=1 Tax=Periplaneta americana TaxID=6978 RepID=A0ABQ8SX65_PERAM|nr:hypothetical protein ANN_14757 [Periplaneta americana]